MSLRGKAAVVGVGETMHRRVWPGRSMWGLCAEAAASAIQDAGLRREDIDGLIGFGTVAAAPLAEYIGIRPVHYGLGSNFAGSSSGNALCVAANIVSNGIANNVLFVGGGARDPAMPDASIFMGGGALPPSVASEWMAPYGPAVAANNNYGMLYTRHMYEFGTKHEQIAQQAARQRFNAQQNERSAFLGQPITLEDVMNSRYINYPLHIMESVMPVAGAVSFIVTTAERARTLRKPPVYILGVGVSQGYSNSWLKPNQVVTPARYSAPAAYNMSGYGVKDVQFANFYD